MYFQIPQFIEVEDKIFGPLTLKQFLYLIGGGAAMFLFYTVFPFFIFILLAIPAGALAGAMAFYKINGRPFVKTMEKSFYYLINPKVYTWRKKEKIIEKTAPKKEQIKAPLGQPEIYTPKLTKSKLSDLAWGLDIRTKTSRRK